MVVGEESTSPARMASPSAGIYSSANASIRVGTASEASGPTSGGGHRSKFHPVTFHHSHFNKNIEKENLSMTQLKQALFPNALNNSGTDQAVRMSDIRVGPIYLGEKVFMRTGSGTLTRDSRAIALEKVKRRELVNRTGFSSSNHETYKPLGEPILEAEKLISTSLNISITPGPFREHHGSSHSTQRNFQNIETQEESPQSGKEKQAHVNDGFDVLKEKLLKAKYRLQAIKFGIPLSKTLQSTTWLEEAKPVQTVTSSTESFHDWTPSKLDREKMIHYLRLLLPTFSNPMPTNDTKPSSSSSPPPPASSSSTVILPKLVKPSKDHRSSVLEMEHALMIQRPQLPDPETLLHQMRMNFNKEKHRLSGTFKSQLLQVERERPALIYEKFRVFQIGVNGICSSDLERMRVNAKRRRRQERHRLLDIHPWYKEMVKITSNHPLKKTLSEGERALLYQVGVRIGDKVPFTKHEFVDILKSVPTSEYMKEEVQKLIKFLKLQIGLTELEYLDAIELSGQMLTTNSTSF